MGLQSRLDVLSELALVAELRLEFSDHAKELRDVAVCRDTALVVVCRDTDLVRGWGPFRRKQVQGGGLAEQGPVDRG